MKPLEYGFSENPMFKANGYKPPNSHKWGPGVRDVYALHYILSGRGYLKTCQTTFLLQTGESFIIFPHMEVYYHPDPQDIEPLYHKVKAAGIEPFERERSSIRIY
ncbi:AraC family ligand binding domain-containing protein [Paenibacillus sp. IHB B 3415]|uniref:AraC family ligand binding domain-containing protein n=1 Tax=Paenibacillus sp. IHB B 3415 TaxID=867080 RepID=UPI00057C7D3D|nr:AraC family ligand binding domain-containing protein [Paenibacillus sp. IHB B 3415]